ncbi:MAG: antibiotic biosynthesis monooxygenase [Rhodospirillales bacterium]|nr:antibiotic biosynthesis monooxygenase [Rhodospirillales bacterium]
MAHFVLIVTVEVNPGDVDAFRAAILENAKASVQEAECHRFDVVSQEDNKNVFVFYEEYTNAAALDAHMQSEHFKKYREATEGMSSARDVKRCTVIS